MLFVSEIIAQKTYHFKTNVFEAFTSTNAKTVNNDRFFPYEQLKKILNNFSKISA